MPKVRCCYNCRGKDHMARDCPQSAVMMKGIPDLPPNMALGNPMMPGFPQNAIEQGGGMRGGGPNQVRGYPPNPRGAILPPAQLTQANLKSVLVLQTQLLTAKPDQRKQLLGEALFDKISVLQPELAGKITGMLLEMDDAEVFTLIEDEVTLRDKVDEAMNVYDEYLKGNKVGEAEGEAAGDESKEKDEKA